MLLASVKVAIRILERFNGGTMSSVEWLESSGEGEKQENKQH